MLDSSKTASRSVLMMLINLQKHNRVDGKANITGVDDGESGAGGELPHGGAHTHVRHTAEYSRTGWQIGRDTDVRPTLASLFRGVHSELVDDPVLMLMLMHTLINADAMVCRV